jgi:DNA transformation protein and related proteins
MERPPFVEHCSELLAPLGTVRARRMFGGWGLYVDELFVALIAYECLYLKADAAARERFAAAGCEPFVYNAQNKQLSLGYWSAPDEAMDSPTLMQPWARLALQAALAARTAKMKPVKPARAARKAATRPAAKARRA